MNQPYLHSMIVLTNISSKLNIIILLYYYNKMNILLSFGIIVSTFSISTITSFLICYANNYPFMTPTFSNEKRMTRINEYIRNVPLLICQSTGLMYIVSDNIIPCGQHTWFESLYSMCLYCLLIEGNYYI